MTLEKPQYQLIKKENAFELREYAPYITAQVSIIAKDHRDAANRGFGTLANYIFGNNVARQKISMTSPVTAVPSSEKIAMTAPVTISGEGSYIVSFSMPSQYTMETLPQPANEQVRLIQHPQRRMAALRFSGVFKQKNFDRQIHTLRNWIREQNLQEMSPPVVAGYNPPITPWFLKHNEILIEVAN